MYSREAWYSEVSYGVNALQRLQRLAPLGLAGLSLFPETANFVFLERIIKIMKSKICQERTTSFELKDVPQSIKSMLLTFFFQLWYDQTRKIARSKVCPRLS